MSRRRCCLTATLAAALALTPACQSVAGAARPNIIFVLTDDLTWNLVRYMPHVRAMERDGTSFTRFYVTDSLCCPSRASILTGDYPHNTGVYTNTGTHGGFRAFRRHGDDLKTFGLALQRAGYRTGFIGKYLNDYVPTDGYGTGRPYMPPGWNTWDVAGNGYPEYGYLLNENGRVHYYGSGPRDYLTSVIARKGTAFVRSAAAAHRPFALELSTFAPHRPAVPAPSDAHRFRRITMPRSPAFNHLDKAGALRWERLPALTPLGKRHLNERFRQRVRAVQAVDRLVGRLQRELRADGPSRDTYLVFSSDNGFHLGAHRFRAVGKNTAFDPDIRVPLIVAGPGLPAGRRVSKITQTIDLYPTFADIAGAGRTTRTDGRSLVPLLYGRSPRDWRKAALIEHRRPGPRAATPSRRSRFSGAPPSYEAIRSAKALYVEYATGTREYYNTARDPDELHNTAHSLTVLKRHHLHALLAALEHCHGASCFPATRAGGPSTTVPPPHHR